MRRWAFVSGGIAVGVVVAMSLLAFTGAGPFGGDRVESVPWTSAIVSEDGQSITVAFVGAEEFPEDDPCHVDYSIRLSEGTEELRITVEGREDGGSKACTAAGMFRSLSADLSSPLAERQLVDGHDGRINPVRSVDGRCLQPPVRGPVSSDSPRGASSTSTLAPPPPPIDACDT
jgi:hypothetical protein